MRGHDFEAVDLLALEVIERVEVVVAVEQAELDLDARVCGLSQGRARGREQGEECCDHPGAHGGRLVFCGAGRCVLAARLAGVAAGGLAARAVRLGPGAGLLATADGTQRVAGRQRRRLDRTPRPPPLTGLSVQKAPVATWARETAGGSPAFDRAGRVRSGGGRTKRGHSDAVTPFRERMSGGVLLSHPVPRAVPSALKGLASGFGMRPGVSLSPWPP